MTARVGKKMKAAEPLPESVWRYWLGRLAFLVLVALGANLIMVGLLALMQA
jgi:hypothetical protein